MSESATDDELLTIRCQLGEPAAFEALVQKWHGHLWTYVQHLTGDRELAADVVQEVWIRVIRGIPRLRDGGKFRPWIFGISRRVVMDHLRRKYAEPVLISINDAETSTIADDGADDPTEEIAFMHEELARMSAPEREVLVLFYLQELSLDEMTDILGVPIGTVKSRLFRARRTLRAHLKERGI